MSDSYIQIVPNSTGAKVDVSEITRADTTTVERQRIVISDPSDTDHHACARTFRSAPMSDIP